MPGQRKKEREAGAISIDDGPLDDLWNQASSNMEGLEASLTTYLHACALSPCNLMSSSPF